MSWREKRKIANYSLETIMYPSGEGLIIAHPQHQAGLKGYQPPALDDGKNRENYQFLQYEQVLLVLRPWSAYHDGLVLGTDHIIQLRLLASLVE